MATILPMIKAIKQLEIVKTVLMHSIEVCCIGMMSIFPPAEKTSGNSKETEANHQH